MSRVRAVSKAILNHLLDDFRQRALGSDALHEGYVGMSLGELRQKCIGDQGGYAVDFDLALEALESGDFVATGPMVPIENQPNSMVVFVGMQSKREYICLAEKGYRMIEDDFLFPDRVAVKTASDGQWHQNIKAQVERDKITLLESTLPITEGDQLRRKLPNGITEEYTIEHVEFQVDDMDFPAMIVAHVRKQGSGLHERQHSAQNVYNLTGANPRVNVNSVDSSVNVLAVNSDTLFSNLAKAIGEQVQDAKLSGQLTELVQQMERTRGTHDFTVNFQSFMALAANCMTVVLPFVPPLAQMLK